MILKIDLEKAYDRLQWSFLFECLTLTQFPPILIDHTKQCLKSISMRIL